MGSALSVIWSGHLPFFSGVQTNAAPAELLPFTLALLTPPGLIIQAYDLEVDARLSAVHRESFPLTTPAGCGPFGTRRGEDFLRFLGQDGWEAWRGRRVLEIGCSNGYLLAQLRAQDADAVGCEPSPQAVEATARYGIPVVRAFFTPELFPEPFDIVCHLNVLEHVPDPRGFLQGNAAVLAEDGRLLLGVPNAEPDLLYGDVGMIVHEHWTYFTARSLRRLLEEVFEEVHVGEGYHASTLYAACGRPRREPIPATREDGDPLAREYGTRLDALLQRLQRRLALLQGECVVLYGISCGAVNLLALLDWRGVDVRFFDSDPEKHGKWIPGAARPIEPPEILPEAACSELWILPTPFAAEIRRDLRPVLGGRAGVWTLPELLEGRE